MIQAEQIIPGSVMTGSAASYYVATSTTIIQSMNLVNTTGAAVACTVYLIPPTGVVGADTTIISARSIGAGETYTCPEAIGMVLAPNAKIQAFGSGVTIMASGARLV